MAETFFTSDTHFFHRNIIGYGGRPFKNIEEMNDTLVRNWNSVVGVSDVVYHLGDVAFCLTEKKNELNEIFSGLNGRKILLMGNHDRINISRDIWKVQDYFQDICLWKIFPKWNFFAAHIPLEDNEDNFRHIAFQVHGHIHQQDSPSSKYINVCVEKTGYTPVHVDVLLKQTLGKGRS